MELRSSTRWSVLLSTVPVASENPRPTYAWKPMGDYPRPD